MTRSYRVTMYLVCLALLYFAGFFCMQQIYACTTDAECAPETCQGYVNNDPYPATPGTCTTTSTACTGPMCTVLAGCDCFQNPQICGTCPGSQSCNTGMCPDGITSWTNQCTPDCSSAGRVCHQSPSCSTTDCRIVGCGSGQGDCGTVTNAGCGQLVCMPGGNCETSCVGCLYPSPIPGGGCDASCGACGYRGPNPPGTCSSNGSCCIEPNPTPPPNNSTTKTCSITSISSQAPVIDSSLTASVTVGYKGGNTGAGASELINLYIEKWPTTGVITPAPGTPTPAAAPEKYIVGNCTSSGTNMCTGNVTIPSLPIGSYYVHCEAPNDPGKCKGDPYCTYEGVGGTSSCTGWLSCSSKNPPTVPYGDNVFVEVTCNPNLWLSYGACSGSPAIKTRLGDVANGGCAQEQSTGCTGTINARAVVVSSADTSCDAAQISGTALTGTVTNQFTSPPSAASLGPTTQSGAHYVTNSTVGGYYVLNQTVPSDYAQVATCWRKTSSGGALFPNGTTQMSGTGLSEYVSSNNSYYSGDNETITWDIGYRAGLPWVQTGGGHVYAGGALTTKVPSTKLFNLDGAALYPGIVVYGSSCDFDANGICGDETTISTKNWLAQQSYAQVDYYDYFYKRLGSPTTIDTFADLTAVTQPVSRPTPYYVNGNMTTSGDWSVGDGQTIIFLVDGNLTVGGKINITGTGFVSFIVHGNITIDPSVGTNLVLATPQLQGVYIATNALHSATFNTGATSAVTATTARLVAKGIFIADTFSLQRDLDFINIGDNITTAAEQFTYDPNLFIGMPDSMKDMPITWQEVAP